MSQDKRQSIEDVTGVEYQRFLIKYARERLAADNFYDADFALQVCHSREPHNAVMFNLRALLAYRLGLYQHALGYVKTALQIRPKWERAQQNLALIEKAWVSQQQHISSKTDDEKIEKFLLINSWGSGLGFDLLYLLQQLLLAEMCQRTPVIHWGVNSVYNSHPDSDCFSDYFNPISKLGIDDVVGIVPDVFPTIWQSRPLKDHIRRTRWRNTVNGQFYKIAGPYYLNRSEKLVVSGEFSTIKMLLPWMLDDFHYANMAKTPTAITDIYRDLIKRYLKPKKYLQNRADKFIQQSFKKTKGSKKPAEFIAIHLRGTDKHREKQSNSLAEINAELINQVEQYEKQLPIFVMTDDSRQIETMKKRFGDRIHALDVTRSTDDDVGIHLTGKNKKKLAEEVIVDMLIAQKASHFFGCGFSYLACVISYMRASDDSSTLLPMDLMTRFMDIPVPN